MQFLSLTHTFTIRNTVSWTSLVIQWLRLCTYATLSRWHRFDPWLGKISHILWCGTTAPRQKKKKKREKTVSQSLSPLFLSSGSHFLYFLVSCCCSLQMHPWVEPYHSVRGPPHRFISVSSFWFSPYNIFLFLWLPFFSFVKWTPATEYTCIYAGAYLLVK